MRILVLHNRYLQPGGEDVVAAVEAEMLRSRGMDVIEETCSNQTSEHDGSLAKARLLLASGWSRQSYTYVSALCAKYRPEVVHVHNFWMRLSPAVHAACWQANAGTVQTLHNFRLLCTNANFLRDGVACQDCLGKVPWRGIVHRCYRDSYTASAAVASMVCQNRWRQTWDRYVAAYIALTTHSHSRFVAGGLPVNRLFVKPNFVRDPGQAIALPSNFKKVVYVGRLSREKGVETLIRAWANEDLSKIGQLSIIGDGPERQTLQNLASSLGLSPPGIEFLGQRASSEVLQSLRAARCLALPSLCFENFPMAVAEAFSCGRAAVVSRIGAAAELVQDLQTGLTVPAGDPIELGRALRLMLTQDECADRMGHNARAKFLESYTPERNFELLMDIYSFAIEFRRSQGAKS